MHAHDGVWPRRALQAGLFVGAILTPCLVLVALSVRVVVQERELAGKHAQDSRRLSAERAGQALISRLERRKLDALRRLSAASGPPADDGVVLLSVAAGGRLLSEWHPAGSPSPGPDAADAAVSQHMARGEREEFMRRGYLAALSAYLDAAQAARTPVQRAAARLAIVRAARAAGRDTDAEVALRELLEMPVAVMDEEGVPFALYACAAVLNGPKPSDDMTRQVVAALGNVANGASPVSLAAWHMAGDVAQRIGSTSSTALLPGLAEVRRHIAARLADATMAHALRDRYPALRAQLMNTTEPVWVPFGSVDDLWLVTETQPLDLPQPIVVAVRAAAALEDLARVEGHSAMRLSLEPAEGLEPLGARLPNLFVTVPPIDIDSSLSRGLVVAAVVVTLAVALSGGLLVWRDINRDLRLSALRSQFVASVSHELKTPLTSIRMFAETLRLGRTPPAATGAYLDTIVSESERLTRLLNNVLDFSKIEQGVRTYRFEPRPLAPIVRSAAHTMRYPLEQQGFVLNTAVDVEDACALCDGDAIEQAILNLLSNAMKYSGEQRSIDLRLARHGDDCVIAVSDRGIGVPGGEQSKIFEKFYRGAGEGHQRVAGTGLGLTLVAHTMAAHGGRVTVESEPGRGSTFTMTLCAVPLATGQDRLVEGEPAWSSGAG